MLLMVKEVSVANLHIRAPKMVFSTKSGHQIHIRIK